MAVVKPLRLLLVLLCWLSVTACDRRSPNVLLVTFDTTRFDAVGYATGRSGLTPTLDALAARGTWFETATASAPITLPSHATILTGLEPYRHGVRNNGTYVLDGEVTTMAECLAARGYRTHAVISAYVLDSRFGLDQGFAGYDDDLSGVKRDSRFMSRQIVAEDTADKTLAWLEATEGDDRPFFLWVHFFDPHADYDPPPVFASRFPDDPYQAEVVYADAELGRVIDALERRGLLASTVAVFLADHGESLGEHGEQTHGVFLYDATTLVPMLLAGPGVEPGHRVTTPVRSVDVMPTVLDLVGAPVPPGLDGISLVPVMSGTARAPRAYMEAMMPRLNYGWSELRALRFATAKAILAPRREYYDLVRDPGELDNLVDSPATDAAPIEAAMDELEDLRLSDPFTFGGQQELSVDGDTLSALAALGYTRDQAETTRAGLADPKDRIAEYEALSRANNLIDDGRLDEAKAELASLILEHPTNIQALLSLAYVHTELGEPAAARATLEQILTSDPTHPEALRLLARSLADSGDIGRAEEMLTAALAAHPVSLDLTTELCRLFETTDRISEARACWVEALEIDDSDTGAMVGLARCLDRLGDPDDAHKRLAQAIRVSPHDPVVVEALADSHRRRGELQQSIELLELLCRLEPDNPSAWNNLASQLAQSQRFGDGAEAAQRGFELEPDNLAIRANLGAMLILSGRLEEGVGHLDAVLPAMPENTYGAELRARALEHLGRNDEALSAWLALAAREPAAGVYAARLQLEVGDEPAARASLADALDRGGDRARDLALSLPELEDLLGEASGRARRPVH